MSMEDLIKRTTISFKKPLDKPTMEDLLHHIALNLKCLITPVWESSGAIKYIPSPKEVVSEKYTSRYGGGITKTEKTFESVLFECEIKQDYKKRKTFFTKLKFITTLDCTLEQIPKDELKLMDEVRECISNYYHFK